MLFIQSIVLAIVTLASTAYAAPTVDNKLAARLGGGDIGSFGGNQGNCVCTPEECSEGCT